MKTIVYELNEVPKRLFDFYSDAFPNSAFGRLREHSRLFETVTADIGSLSPWVTWPTMHRGVSNVDHTISDLGQDLEPINSEFPPLWEILARKGIKVGLFGCLQSYPIPQHSLNYEFYIPDTFASGVECHPEILSIFQKFNLAMVKSNGRNVSKKVAWNDAGNFLINSLRLGLTSGTAKNLAKQMIIERFNPDRIVRRRTSQVEIAFDLFYNQLRSTRPDISFFFTNHLASSMHRFWPTVFPKDYDEGKFELDWLARWRGEIPHAVRVANFQLSKLIRFSELNEFRLIVASSMGQHAVQNATAVKSQGLITNISKLFSYLDIPRDKWAPRMAMAPQLVVQLLDNRYLENLKILEEIRINDKKIKSFVTSTGDIRLELKLVNPKEIDVYHGSDKIDAKALGVSKIDIQDAAGANAYHIPQGILLDYSPRIKYDCMSNNIWKSVSVLDYAPSIMKEFGIPKMPYMTGDDTLFG